jgi:hypothetical protein
VSEDLIYRLRKRAEIRRQISTRKSVQEGKPDRIADLLEEAATELELTRGALDIAMKTAEYAKGQEALGVRAALDRANAKLETIEREMYLKQVHPLEKTEYNRGYEQAIDHITSLAKSRGALDMYSEAYRAAFTDLLVILAAYRERKGPSTTPIGDFY